MITIGKLAREAGISADALRYYEKEGLLAPVRKTAAGYRLYDREAARRLQFIKHAQQCGFSLAEIRELLELRTRKGCGCPDVRAVATAKKAQLQARIQALQVLVRALSGLIEVCNDDSKSPDDCPILLALETALQQDSPPSASKTTHSEYSPGRRRRRSSIASGRNLH